MVWPLFLAPADGRKVTVHDAEVPLADSVHCVALKVPLPLLVKLTVPDGAVAVPGEVSLTTAVHFWARFPDFFLWQVRTVEVARAVTVTTACPLLAAWLPSPPYDAVTVWVPEPAWSGT